MPGSKPNYRDSDPVFQMRKYIRWADEHIQMWELAQESDVISWEVKETETPLKIPVIYTVEYRIRSIIGINENQDPIYGDRHVLEIGVPTSYPLHACTLYMKTNAWHPNIQSEGQNKGRVCGNVRDFGLNYSIRDLVIRVGEILQYKNYLADSIPPYPEDVKVAKWVKEVAEPKGIVDLTRQIFVDNTPLIRIGPKASEPSKDQLPLTSPQQIKPESSEENPSDLPDTDTNKPTDPNTGGVEEGSPKIRIKSMNPDPTPSAREKIVIKPKDN